jgi:hypothetical protein
LDPAVEDSAEDDPVDLKDAAEKEAGLEPLGATEEEPSTEDDF